MELMGGIKTFHAKSRKIWRKWLEKNHRIEKSVWLIIFKKESGIPSVYYPEAVDEAICFGWIDSKINKRDEYSYFQYFARRNPKSNWSKVNKAKVEKLIQEGIMENAGLEMIDIAKKNGKWNALDGVENLEIPGDLQKAFNKYKKALDYWNKFPRSAKRGILEWIMNAKRKETRARRIEETVRLAAENIKANYPG
jgi:uncharacterized protein YdeI (YjbR/CyaY-like superfamily)